MPDNDNQPISVTVPIPQRPSQNEIIKWAAKDLMPDAGMTTEDWLLWYMMRDIYRAFRDGTMGKDEGARQKTAAIRIHDRARERRALSDTMCDRFTELWKRLEETSSAYRKERTLDNADNLMRVVYGFV